MKTHTHLLICLSALLAMALLTSCANTGEPLNIRQEVALWTQDITELTLIAKPEYRPVMESAVNALTAAEGSGGIDLNAITAALSRASALQSTDSKLGLIGGRLILRRALGNVQLETPDSINQAGLGLRDGLKAALGPSVIDTLKNQKDSP